MYFHVPCAIPNELILWSGSILCSWAEKNITFAHHGVLCGIQSSCDLSPWRKCHAFKISFKFKILKIKCYNYNFKVLELKIAEKHTFKKISGGRTSEKTYAHLHLCQLYSLTPRLLEPVNPLMARLPTDLFLDCSSPKKNLTRKPVMSASYKDIKGKEIFRELYCTVYIYLLKGKLVFSYT